MSEIRRVVTALDAGDKAVAVLDSALPLKPGRSANPAAVLWITDSNPAGYSSQDTAKPIGIPPPDNGSIFRVVEFLPTTNAEIAKIDHTHMTSVIGDKTPDSGAAAETSARAPHAQRGLRHHYFRRNRHVAR